MTKEQANEITRYALEELALTLDAGHSDTLTAYLDFMARFHHYSWNNVLLIVCQRPGATYVAGYNSWERLGRPLNRADCLAGQPHL